MLAAIAQAGITVTLADDGDDRRWHLTPLSKLVRRVLAYLGLAEDVYTGLVINSS